MRRKFLVGALVLVGAFLTGAQAEEPTERHGSFTLRIISDPMTDAARGILASSTKEITMVVKCDGNGPGTLYVSFISDHYLGALRYNTRDIKFRLDSAPPEAISAWYDGSTANILDLKPGTNGGRWFARVLGASKLTVQVTDFNYQAYTDVIDLTGFRSGVGRAAAVCKDANWYGAAG